MNEFALTTKDNPYSPFDEWELWLARDHELGHNTNEKIARLSNPSLDIEDESTLEQLYFLACMFIIEYDFEDLYHIVTQEAVTQD